MRTLVIGYGNQLRGDDGAGWELAEQARLENYSTLRCVQLTPEMAAELLDYGRIVFADSTQRSGPVTLSLLESRPTTPWPLHCARPEDLLGLCLRLFGQCPEGWLLELPGEDFGFQEGLTATARASVTAGLEQLRKLTS